MTKIISAINFHAYDKNVRKSACILVISAIILLFVGIGQAAAETTRTPSRAADFTWSLGVGVHLGAYGGPYASLPDIFTALKFIGVRHLRDSVKTTSWDIARVQQLGAAGFKFDYILSQSPLAYQSSLHQVAPYLEYLEGPNEVDAANFLYAGLVGIPAGITLQKLVYPQVKQDPVIGDLPVLNFTIAGWGDTVQAGNMAPYANYGNFHFYPFVGRTPLPDLSPSIADKTDVRGKSLIATETGFSTVKWNAESATARGNEGCDEEVQAKDLLDDILDMYNAQIYRTYIYELVDEVYDSGNTNLDFHYGLFRTDWSPKPSAVALHNLLAILTDNAANPGNFTPSPLTYTLTDTTASGALDFSKFSVLLQKADGTTYLVVWAEPRLWDAVNHVELPIAPGHDVQLVLPTAAKTINIYNPMVGTTPAAGIFKSRSNVANIDFYVVDTPIVVEIKR